MYRLLTLASAGFLLFCQCAGDGKLPAATEDGLLAVGSVRFEESSRRLRAELVLSPTDSTGKLPVPTFLGTGMLRPSPTDYGRFVSDRTLAFPSELRFSVPRGLKHRTAISYSFAPPFIDSIPTTISKANGAIFPALRQPLAEGQQVEFFFEPTDRGQPHRILVTGPYSRTRVSLNKDALAGVPAGEYLVYLIGQQIDKGEEKGLRYSIQTEYFTLSKRVVVE